MDEKIHKGVLEKVRKLGGIQDGDEILYKGKWCVVTKFSDFTCRVKNENIQKGYQTCKLCTGFVFLNDDRNYSNCLSGGGRFIFTDIRRKDTFVHDIFESLLEEL